MLVLAWIVSLVAAIYGGYQWRKLEVSIKEIRAIISNKVVLKPEPKKDDPVVLDPYDIEQQAKYQYENDIKNLNE